jgi:hypothetical protein
LRLVLLAGLKPVAFVRANQILSWAKAGLLTILATTGGVSIPAGGGVVGLPLGTGSEASADQSFALAIDVQPGLSSDQTTPPSLSVTDASGQSQPSVPPESRRYIWAMMGGLAIIIILVSVILLGQRRQVAPDALHKQKSTAESRPDLPVLLDGSHDHSSEAVDSRVAPDEFSVNSTTRLVPINIVDTLLQELTSPDMGIRQKAIWELGQRGNSLALQPLVNAMLDADSHEKSLILGALAAIGSRSLQPMHRAMALSLQDPSPEVRKNAIRDLTRIYDQMLQLGQLLSYACQDTDPEVQQTAEWALAQFNRLPMSQSSTEESKANSTRAQDISQSSPLPFSPDP